MPLFSAACAVVLGSGTPCPAVPPAPRAISASELADVRGRALPMVGLDQAGPAGRANAVDIAFNGLRTSDQTRDMFDNWNLSVAVPLIAEAMTGGRR